MWRVSVWVQQRCGATFDDAVGEELDRARRHQVFDAGGADLRLLGPEDGALCLPVNGIGAQCDRHPDIGIAGAGDRQIRLGHAGARIDPGVLHPGDTARAAGRTYAAAGVTWVQDAWVRPAARAARTMSS